jgi:hypothetical protein
MEREQSFSLAKWYLDCVAESGEAIVAYSAWLRWKTLSLEYSSILARQSSGRVITRATLHRGTLPRREPDGVRWTCPHLGIDGLWKSREPSFERTIFDLPTTPLTWLCVHPRAEAEIDAGSFGRFKGLGYVDFIETKAKPWQLPLEELRWGRFLSSTDWLIWMDFRGPWTECLVFHNGAPVQNARVSDSQIECADQDLRLTFEETEVLREGALGSTVLSVIPGVQKLMPGRMLATKELKWRSRGILRSGGVRGAAGWAIHEVVKWPSPSVVQTV